MSHPPFLKSIRPVNLLSLFGPDTKEIELRPLNILIGPNGCGKSNLIEVIGLLSKLPDKDPFSTVIETGGAREWIWKGKNTDRTAPSLSVETVGQKYPAESQNVESGVWGQVFSALGGTQAPRNWTEKRVSYSITLRDRDNSFEVVEERFRELDRWDNDAIQPPWFGRDGWVGLIHSPLAARRLSRAAVKVTSAAISPIHDRSFKYKQPSTSHPASGR